MVGNRALDDPGAFGVEHNDALAVRDLGWQLVWVDSAQEALDTALIAYRVAEDRRIFLPCAISCDGAFLTHSQALVKIPSAGEGEGVPAALRPRRSPAPPRQSHHRRPAGERGLADGDPPPDRAAMERSPGVIREAYADFERIFGRRYGNPFFEEYETEDADVVLVGMGTLSNPVRVAIRRDAQGGQEGWLRAHALVPAVRCRGAGAIARPLRRRSASSTATSRSARRTGAASSPPRYARRCTRLPKRPPMVGVHRRPRRPRGHGARREEDDGQRLPGRGGKAAAGHAVDRAPRVAGVRRVRRNTTWLRPTECELVNLNAHAEAGSLQGREEAPARGVLHLRVTAPARAASPPW